MKYVWTLLTLLFAAIAGYIFRGNKIVTAALNKNETLKKQSEEKEKAIADLKKQIDSAAPPKVGDATSDDVEKFWEKK